MRPVFQKTGHLLQEYWMPLVAGYLLLLALALASCGAPAGEVDPYGNPIPTPIREAEWSFLVATPTDDIVCVYPEGYPESASCWKAGVGANR